MPDLKYGPRNEDGKSNVNWNSVGIPDKVREKAIAAGTTKPTEGEQLLPEAPSVKNRNN